MLFTGDLDLARAVVLDLTLDPSGPGAQLHEDGPRSYPMQYDHNGSMWKNRL